MAQFDVYRNAARASARRIPYLLDIQANLLSELSTRVVIPLLDPAVERIPAIANLNPIFVIGGRQLILLAQEIAGVPAGILGAKVENLADRRSEVLRAIDLLWTGT